MQTPLQTIPSLPPEQRRTLTERARSVWASGDFARVGARTVLAGELLSRSLEIHAGERVLDVAAGSGSTAIAAARRGARATATDFVPALLEAAAVRAEAETLPLETVVADAQDLPFEDGSFDVVVSTFGVMFAPDRQLAADELLRVCRPGGRIGLANWTPEGLIGRYSAVSARHVPPPAGAPPLASPLEWGTEAGLQALFGDRVTNLRATRQTTDLCAESARAMVDYNRTWFGPTRVGFSQLDDARAERFAADLAAELERFNQATDGTLVAPAEYLEVVAVRS